LKDSAPPPSPGHWIPAKNNFAALGAAFGVGWLLQVFLERHLYLNPHYDLATSDRPWLLNVRGDDVFVSPVIWILNRGGIIVLSILACQAILVFKNWQRKRRK